MSEILGEQMLLTNLFNIGNYNFCLLSEIEIFFFLVRLLIASIIFTTISSFFFFNKKIFFSAIQVENHIWVINQQNNYKIFSILAFSLVGLLNSHLNSKRSTLYLKYKRNINLNLLLS